MVTEKQVRNAYVRWQIAESAPAHKWSMDECLTMRKRYYVLRDEWMEQKEEEEQ